MENRRVSLCVTRADLGACLPQPCIDDGACCLPLAVFGTALSAAGGEEGEGFFRAMDMRKLLQTTPPTQAVGYLVCGLGNRTLPQHRTFQAKRLC